MLKLYDFRSRPDKRFVCTRTEAKTWFHRESGMEPQQQTCELYAASLEYATKLAAYHFCMSTNVVVTEA